MLEAEVRVDAAAAAQNLPVWTVDHAHAIFADLVVEAGLATATTVQDVQFGADADAGALGLLRVCTHTASIRDLVLREIGVLLPAAQHCNHREQHEPHMFWK
jgi:hypothetical protein